MFGCSSRVLEDSFFVVFFVNYVFNCVKLSLLGNSFGDGRWSWLYSDKKEFNVIELFI